MNISGTRDIITHLKTFKYQFYILSYVDAISVGL